MKIDAIFPFQYQKDVICPFFGADIAAGFPSPADDYIDKGIDLNQELIDHPAATFFLRVRGESMKDAGIIDGDTLVVDRSLKPYHNAIIVAFLNGEFTVKRYQKKDARVYLIAENVDYENILVTAQDDFEVWGVVRHTIHTF